MDTYSQKATTVPSYDLNSEKERISAITVEIKKELIDEWQRKNAGKAIFPELVANANPHAIEFLLSFGLVDTYEEIAKVSNLSDKQKNTLPLLVWDAFLAGSLGGAENSISEKIGIEEVQKNSLAKILKERILNELGELNVRKISISEKRNTIAAPLSEQKSSDIVKMTLHEALEKHKNIGDQLITSLPLKLRIFPDVVRPSIKNWISDYHDHVGSGKHGTIERGNFLFHSENGKKLQSLDRLKLAEVLKALDDKDELNIDTRLEKLVFSKATPLTAKAISNTPPTRTLPNNMEKVRNEKVDNFFANENTQKKSDIYSQKPSVVVIESFTKAKDKTDNLKKNELNRSFGSFNVQGGKSNIANKTATEDERRLKPSWNPAENVRKKMEGDEISAKKEIVGNIKFSSPQVLPTEKNERLSTFPPKEVKITEEAALSDKPHPDDNTHTDELIERIRNMNKNKDKNVQARSSYKITPVGFSRNEDSLSFNNGGNGSGNKAIDLT